MQNNIKYCPFCGHWLNTLAEKCTNCGEFLDIKSKRSLWHLIPNWISILATLTIAIAAVLGVVKVRDILQKERVKAVENHLTWIEVFPIAFTTKGEDDPHDSSDVTFWYLQFQAQNLGKEMGYFHIKDWEFKSKKRGAITPEAYKKKDRKFTVGSGETLVWTISFVMSPEYHIEPLIRGEDALEIKLTFVSQDMAGKEECDYTANWKYERGKFYLINDERQYKLIKE